MFKEVTHFENKVENVLEFLKNSTKELKLQPLKIVLIFILS